MAQKLETITGNLLRAGEFQPGTFQTSAELTQERLTNKELRNRVFYTGNFTLYTIEDGEAVLYFGGREANPILANLEDAFNQLKRNGNYVLDSVPEDVTKSVDDGHTLRINLDDLDLKKRNTRSSFFDIDTLDYLGLNNAQIAFAGRIYGQGEDFDKAMTMFSKAHIKSTRVYVLNPGYVHKNPQNNAVVRACWLYYFNFDSNFFANGRLVNLHFSLRGVLSAEGGDAQNLVTLPVDGLYGILERNVAPDALANVKEQIKNIYQ